MSRQKVKTKVLSKLRRFRPGMDVQSFMETEFNQLVRALENMYVDQEETEVVEEGDTTNVTVTNGSLVFTSSISSSVGTGTVGMTSSNSVAITGTLTSNQYFPPEDGKYLVEFGFRLLENGSNVTATGTLTALYTSASIAGTADGTAIKTFNTDNGRTQFPKNAIFMDLTTTLGVYFTMAVSNASASKFYCKIFKVQ